MGKEPNKPIDMVEIEGVYVSVDGPGGKSRTLALSRQMVLFCVERRRSWRMLQSRAGIENPDYRAQCNALELLDSDEMTKEDVLANLAKLFDDELARLLGAPRGSATNGKVSAGG